MASISEIYGNNNNKIDVVKNRVVKTPQGDDIYYNGYLVKGLKKGDIMLRPILEDSIIDKISNAVSPGEYEHVSMYAGDGKIINIYPDKKGAIHIEDLFGFLDFYEKLKKNPKIITFVRMTNDPVIANKAVQWLKDSKKMGAKFNYTFLGNVSKETNGQKFYNGYNCAGGIVQAYLQAGMKKKELFTSPKLSWQFLMSSYSGNQLYKKSVKKFKFFKIQ